MTATTSLIARRNKCLSLRDRGVITDAELANAFFRLLADAPDDHSALCLCENLPLWCRGLLCNALEDLSTTGFYRRSFGVGDSRSPEEVHRDALLQQELLARLAMPLKSILQLGSD